MSAPVILFENAAPDHRSLSLSLGPGECALIQHADVNELLFGDWALGLEDPKTGRVQFGDRAWNQRGIRQAASARAEIGRIYEEPRFLNNLNISENTTLAIRYHHRTQVEEADAHATQLAESMGLDFIRERPARVPEADKLLAQWIRALMLDPKLLVVEFPFSRLSPTMFTEAIWDTVAKHQSRGMAILWLSARPDFAEHVPFSIHKTVALR